MKQSWWRTGPPLKHTQPVLRPTAGQLLQQLVLLALILTVWGGSLFVFLGVTTASGISSLAQVPPTNPPAPATRAATATPPSTNTPLPASTTTATVRAGPTATSRPTEAPTSGPVTGTPAASGDAVSYQRDVQPIFDQICVKCHGGEEVKEGLSLKTYADVMAGSNNGPVIVPGDVNNSFLIEQIVKGKMPKRGPKLLPAQIRVITEWVKEGAPNN